MSRYVEIGEQRLLNVPPHEAGAEFERVPGGEGDPPLYIRRADNRVFRLVAQPGDFLLREV